MSHSSIHPTIRRNQPHTIYTVRASYFFPYLSNWSWDLLPRGTFQEQNISDFVFVEFLGPSLFLKKKRNFPNNPFANKDALDLRYHPCCHHQIHCTGDAVSAPKEKIHVLSQKAFSRNGEAPQNTNKQTNKRTNKQTNELNNKAYYTTN